MTITANPNISIDNLILAQTTRDPRFAGLSAAAREELLRQGRKVLSEELGATLTGKEKIGDIMYRTTNTQLERFAGSYRAYLPVIAAVGFFITAKTLTLPLYWISLLLIFIVVKSLKSDGILKSEQVMIQSERLGL